MEVAEFKALPAEMLERVFRLLPPRDLRAVVMVCRWWREVGEAPGLWAWVRLKVKTDNLAFMPRVLGWRRLQAVRWLKVEAMSEELLQAVARHPGLKVMSMQGTNLYKVIPDLLVRAVTRLEEVEMRVTNLTKPQMEAIFISIIYKDSLLLRKLNISGINLSQVSPDLLARAVTRLEEVKMRRTCLTKQQMEAILTQSLVETSLKVLSSDLDRIQPQPDETLVSRARQVIKHLD
jgi:hypothetical protein